jgi:hypothetical protein
MSLLRRMQNDLISQCRDRVANRIVARKFKVSGENFYTIALMIFGYEVSPYASQFYGNYLRARHFMGEAVRWAGQGPPKGWLH